MHVVLKPHEALDIQLDTPNGPEIKVRYSQFYVIVEANRQDGIGRDEVIWKERHSGDAKSLEDFSWATLSNSMSTIDTLATMVRERVVKAGLEDFEKSPWHHLVQTKAALMVLRDSINNTIASLPEVEENPVNDGADDEDDDSADDESFAMKP